MQKYTNAPLSWDMVVLAILPGVFALGSEVNVWQRIFRIDHEPAWKLDNHGLLLLCASLCVIGFIRENRFTPWSFPALGVTLAMITFARVVRL